MSGYLASARRDHPPVAAAFRLATGWCAGHIIDGGPALGHAVRVATILVKHAPDAPVHVIAACLLHDAPDLAPDEKEMARQITDQCGAEVLDFINWLHAEHEVLADPKPANASRHLATLTSVQWLLHAATADKIVALEYVTGRADRTADAAGFWAARPAFVRLVPYFREIHQIGQGNLPASMSAAYGRLLDRCPTPAGQEAELGVR